MCVLPGNVGVWGGTSGVSRHHHQLLCSRANRHSGALRVPALVGTAPLHVATFPQLLILYVWCGIGGSASRRRRARGLYQLPWPVHGGVWCRGRDQASSLLSGHPLPCSDKGLPMCCWGLRGMTPERCGVWDGWFCAVTWCLYMSCIVCGCGCGRGRRRGRGCGAGPTPSLCLHACTSNHDSSYVLQNNDGTGGECVPSKHAVGGRFIDENFILRVRCGGVHAACIPPAMLLPLETW